MSIFVYLTIYASLIIFFVTVMYKITDYLKKPLHVRWELYPVAHEGKKTSYGGGYLEETDWWDKPRPKSRLGELKVMIPEILFLKAVWENNRKLWYASFPFHFGLYLCTMFMALLGFASIGMLLGLSKGSLILSVVFAITNLCGPAGFILSIAGAAGLFYKRLTDPTLKDYSTFEHFFNLGLFIVTMTFALLTWLLVDPNFNVSRQFATNLISFNLVPIGSSLLSIQMVLIAILLAYIPLTHMSHFFMKYFLYHDIRWGDAPNIDSPSTNAKIGIVLNYPVTWAAPHIAGHGKSTWAEVATFNPTADAEEKKE
ncbi:MAG: nitrate reductase [Deltaproteobacteria bacterium]|nr:nitrate reductase [Deltaproteobacteria bacterium]